MHSQREVEKFSSVAIGMASETIATYMALKADGMIGQQRKAFDSFVVLLSMIKYIVVVVEVDQNTSHKNV